MFLWLSDIDAVSRSRIRHVYDTANIMCDSYLPGHEGCNYTTNFTLDGHFYLFHNYDFRTGYDMSYCYNNKTITAEFLQNSAECLPESYFVWGFSSLLVYIVLCLQMLWTLGMYIVWLDANIYSALCRSGRKIGGHFRAAADLSEAVYEVLRRMTPKVLNCASTECYGAKQASDLSPTENFAASADKYRYYRANWVRNGG